MKAHGTNADLFIMSQTIMLRLTTYQDAPNYVAEIENKCKAIYCDKRDERLRMNAKLRRGKGAHFLFFITHPSQSSTYART